MSTLMRLGADDGVLLAKDQFSGFSGTIGGLKKVPGIRVAYAGNHVPYVLEVSQLNHPEVEHYCGDLQRTDPTKGKPAQFYSASPACPKWTNARGVVRDFDRSNAVPLPGMEGPADTDAMRSRLLMDEVHRDLAAQWMAGQPALVGFVENVVECRKWDQWDRWLGEFHKLGYKTRVIAVNAMHVAPVRALRAPQSRDRLYVAFWLEALGRDPDWDKWLRPAAWCPGCEAMVRAVQTFKDPRADMGRYRAQYVYRCPSHACRGRVLEPEVLPAAAAIDWSIAPTPIGDRAEPLAPKTMARIGTGILRFGGDPALTPAGGTWRTQATPISGPMPTRTTREADCIAAAPGAFLVPMEGRPGKQPAGVSEPMRTMTCRAETALAIPPFIATLRGGGSAKRPATVAEALSTVTASGNHHALIAPPDFDMLVPYYSNGTAHGTDVPLNTVTTRDRYGLVRGNLDVDPEAIARAVAVIEDLDARTRAIPAGRRDSERRALDARAAGAAASMGLDRLLLRMLEPHETGRAQGFDPGFRVFGSKRDQTRGFGNAVVGAVSEAIGSALVEAVFGIELDRYATPDDDPMHHNPC